VRDFNNIENAPRVTGHLPRGSWPCT